METVDSKTLNTTPTTFTKPIGKFKVISEWSVPDFENSRYGTKIKIYDYEGKFGVKIRRYNKNLVKDKEYEEDRVNMKTPEAIREVSNLLLKISDKLEELQKNSSPTSNESL